MGTSRAEISAALVMCCGIFWSMIAIGGDPRSSAQGCGKSFATTTSPPVFRIEDVQPAHLERLAAQPSGFQEYERNFLRQMAKTLSKGGAISPKQADWLRRLLLATHQRRPGDQQRPTNQQ